MKYKKALIIGRFQPFHPGHLYLIKEALKQTERAIICIGSANVSDFDNPYAVPARKKMIETAMSKAGLTDRIEKIITSDDHPDDNAWMNNILSQVTGVDLIVGNNEWGNGIFEKAGYAVLRIPLYKRHIYEGMRIRAKLRNSHSL